MIKEIFLKLTEKTYPHPQEQESAEMINTIISKHSNHRLQEDIWGNRYIKIGESKSLFASHFDTADRGVIKKVTHTFDEEWIKTDGTTILGADDKAGVTIMIMMIINDVPGIYYFFYGEERGLLGSNDLSTAVKYNTSDSPLKADDFNKVISFDRFGDKSVVTHQWHGRCCSDEFGNELAKRLNEAGDLELELDTKGLSTDSAEFMSITPECTNLSVGYLDHHKHTERQDIVFLEKMTKACIEIDWETLPIVREPAKQEFDSYSRNKKKDKKYDYNFKSSKEFSIKDNELDIDHNDTGGGKIAKAGGNNFYNDYYYWYLGGQEMLNDCDIKIFIADKIIESEVNKILHLVESWAVEPRKVYWNGRFFSFKDEYSEKYDEEWGINYLDRAYIKENYKSLIGYWDGEKSKNYHIAYKDTEKLNIIKKANALGFEIELYKYSELASIIKDNKRIKKELKKLEII